MNRAILLYPLALCIVFAAGNRSLWGQKASPAKDPSWTTGPGVDGVPICDIICPDDLNNSGDVNIDDLLAIITAWGALGGRARQAIA